MTSNIGLPKDVVIFDVETTGFSAYNDEITEIALLKVDGVTFEPVAEFSTLIKIDKQIPAKVVELTGITNDMCDKHGMKKEDVKAAVQAFTEDTILVAHNAQFDLEFIKVHFDIDPKYFYDTLTMSRVVEPDARSHKLGEICSRRGISLVGAHRAMNDVNATKDVLEAILREDKRTVKLINHLSKIRAGYQPTYMKGRV